MICNKCNNVNSENALFCTKCGNKLVKEKHVIKKLTKQQLTLGAVCLIVLLIIAVLLIPKKANTRTIMVYTCGSNLEYNNGIVTAELDSIDPTKIDLNKIHVIVYTGGTKEWKNDVIKNTENSILELTKDGFIKTKTFDKKNMGDPETFAEFLNYAYTNYKADTYDLIMYNHGGALDGAIYDDFTNDNLSLSDMHKALEKSPFNSNNKLETVLFRTCLNGTIEVATVFEPYSNYIIFSEEISYGSPFTPVLDFINGLDPSDKGNVFGSKFIAKYNEQMQIIDRFESKAYTYSVIDLSKLSKVKTELDKFMAGVDVAKYYNNISKMRASMYQYGIDNNGYDTVDLYTLVNNLKDYSSVPADTLLKTINEAIYENTTNINTSTGMSIYFPFKGAEYYADKYLPIQNALNISGNYKNFITKFNTMQRQPSSYALNFTKNEVKTTSENEVVLTSFFVKFNA